MPAVEAGLQHGTLCAAGGEFASVEKSPARDIRACTAKKANRNLGSNLGSKITIDSVSFRKITCVDHKL